MSGGQSNADRFYEVYLEELTRAVEQYPEEYPWAAKEPTVVVGNLGPEVLRSKTVEQVAERMMGAVLTDSFNKDGRAFRATCQRLGIKHTYTAIREFVQERS